MMSPGPGRAGSKTARRSRCANSAASRPRLSQTPDKNGLDLRRALIRKCDREIVAADPMFLSPWSDVRITPRGKSGTAPAIDEPHGLDEQDEDTADDRMRHGGNAPMDQLAPGALRGEALRVAAHRMIPAISPAMEEVNHRERDMKESGMGALQRRRTLRLRQRCRPPGNAYAVKSRNARGGDHREPADARDEISFRVRDTGIGVELGSNHFRRIRASRCERITQVRGPGSARHRKRIIEGMGGRIAVDIRRDRSSPSRSIANG